MLQYRANWVEAHKLSLQCQASAHMCDARPAKARQVPERSLHGVVNEDNSCDEIGDLLLCGPRNLCLHEAGLKTFLIAKTGTPDASYEPEFYGGDLLKACVGKCAEDGACFCIVSIVTRFQVKPPQCCTVTIADYTRKFIMDNFGRPCAVSL
eukprot:6453795-Amphidinium_carterae.1